MGNKTNEIVILAAVRTPIGTYKGSLKYIKADKLIISNISIPHLLICLLDIIFSI